MVGEQHVAATIGVEPTGEAFNSIRLTNDNRPSTRWSMPAY
nr:glutaminase [Bradyrhizobium sp. 195]